MNQNTEPTPRDGQDVTEQEALPGTDKTERVPQHYAAGNKAKPTRRIGLGAAISTTVTAVLLAVLLTFSLTAKYYVKEPVIAAKPGAETETTFAAELDTIDRLFRSLTVYSNLDDEALLTAVLKAYVQQTGDKYAQYLTKDEFEELISDQNGTLCGIGVSVIQSTIGEGESAYDTIQIVNVYEDSPAAEAGVQINDCIIRIGTGADAVSVGTVGYEKALRLLRGEEGTQVTFTVLRAGQEVVLTAVRRMLETKFVLSHVYADDPTVGVVRITGFENPTAEQFQASDGCFDRRWLHVVCCGRAQQSGRIADVSGGYRNLLPQGGGCHTAHTVARADGQEGEDHLRGHCQRR